MKKNTITLATAKSWANKWRKEESNYNRYNDCRAFNIPKTDLQEVLKEKGVEGVRAYIGVATFTCSDTGEEIQQEKLMIVGVDKNGKDMISSKDGKNLDAEGGDIFDFTDPCPEVCDPGSPLNG